MCTDRGYAGAHLERAGDPTMLTPERAGASPGISQALGVGERATTIRSPGARSVSETATDYGRQRGLAVSGGGCPRLFDRTADLGHKAMRGVSPDRQRPERGLSRAAERRDLNAIRARKGGRALQLTISATRRRRCRRRVLLRLDVGERERLRETGLVRALRRLRGPDPAQSSSRPEFSARTGSGSRFLRAASGTLSTATGSSRRRGERASADGSPCAGRRPRSSYVTSSPS